MMNVRKMTYDELAQKVDENRWKLDSIKEPAERNRLCTENHDILVEMARRWEPILP